MKRQKLHFILGFCLAISQTVFGQLPEIMKNYPTPNIASLGVYGDVPVGLYTGQPQISIPIHEVKEGSLSVPIYLEYHLSSVKPNTHSSWVGYGWGLTAGGYITRTVRGKADEIMTSGYAIGYYAHKAKVNNINNLDSLRNILGRGLTSVLTNSYELMADEFNFNFCGYSGTFFLKPNGEWTVISDQAIQVEFNESDDFLMSGNTRHFNRFTLIAPDGVRYRFGGENAVEYSIPYYRRVYNSKIATSWYLTEITTPEGQTISLEYESGMPICELRYSPSYSAGSFPISGYTYSNSFNTKSEKALSGFLMFPVYLSKIESSLESVLFHSVNDSGDTEKPVKNWLALDDPCKPVDLFNIYAECTDFGALIGAYGATTYDLRNDISDKLRWRILEAISIGGRGYEGDNDYIYTDSMAKTFYFDYYWYPNSNYQQGQRPHKLLHSITEKSGPYSTNPLPTAEKAKVYRFEYNLGTIQYMPGLSSEDHWGYWNGNKISISADVEDFVQNRQPSYIHTLSETLRSIIYPTGGKTVFDYELRQFSKQQSADHQSVTTNFEFPYQPEVEDLEEGDSEQGYPNQLGNYTAGGLRIAQISTYNYDDQLIQRKKYYYTTDSVPSEIGTSSGILKSWFNYDFHINFTIYSNNNTSYGHLDSYQSGAFINHGFNDNTPSIGYSSVIEETLDASGNSNGYVRYRYSNYDHDIWGNSHLDGMLLYTNVSQNYYFNPYTSKAMERGKLLAEDYYNAQGQIKKSVRYRYKNTNSPDVKLIKHETMFVTDTQHGNQYINLMAAFNTHTYSYLLDSQETTEYISAGNSIRSENRIRYNSDKMVASKTLLQPNQGDSIRTEYKYPRNYSGSPYANMVTLNILSPLVSQKTIYYPSAKWEEQKYNYGQVPNANFYKPLQLQLTNSQGLNLTKAHYTYNSSGNPISIVQNESDTIIYLWGYLHNFPIAEIRNASLNEVYSKTGGATTVNAIAGSIAPSGDDFALINNLRTQLPNAQITTYTYKPLVGMLTATDPRGAVTYYQYDNFGRLQETYYYEDNNLNKKRVIENYDYHYKN
jgi:hypothetical protein